MTTPIIGTAVAPTAPAAPTQDEWWKAAGIDKPTGLIGTAAKWTPTADQTVEGRIKNIVASDSPLSQVAKANADQEMNRRGLINTSMAVGAGQKALYESALPIAQQDAQTFGQAAQFNATADNRASEFNANAANALQAQTNTIKQQTATNNASIAADLAKTNLDNQFKASMVNADAQTKVALAQMDNETRTTLANIDADYKTLIQTSASASSQYNTTIDQVGRIIQNPQMDAAAKASAINGLFERLKVSLNLVGSINGVDLSGLLDFGRVR